MLQCPFPKTLIFKQLKEDLSMRRIIDNILKHKMRHLNKVEKQEPLCDIPLEDYKSMTCTSQFAFEK
jgi:hypothetical protein